ncbi:hypothetical protein RYZ27_12715 [Hyphomonas sp. FCG-A18]|jgi:hypothetical protein|uniref:hypothetical protein n=1 Tax=Hyphomonas sp. FCG-A18 TaxID=3080019 RepID=UPI002B2FDB44|nr:hypothetical protein RYZ27_12715 [Hyphomonas sp. FCG-A18]
MRKRLPNLVLYGGIGNLVFGIWATAAGKSTAMAGLIIGVTLLSIWAIFYRGKQNGDQTEDAR